MDHLTPPKVMTHSLRTTDLEGLIFLVSFIFSGSYTFSASSSAKFPESYKEGFDGDIPFRVECSKVSLSYCSFLTFTFEFLPVNCGSFIFSIFSSVEGT